MAKDVTGAQTLADAVNEAIARKGWRKAEVTPRSKEEMAAISVGRERVGLSERTWQDIWRGQKTYEMDPYSYATIDRTFKWTEGTAWTLHHNQEPPTVGEDELSKLRSELDDLWTRLDEEREQRRKLEEVVSEVHDELRGLVRILPRLLGAVAQS